MFNWYTAPTFVVMLLFWMLAAYVLTRSPRNPASLAAVVVQTATAAYLLGQGMQANASTLAEWRPWARNLVWGATIAPTVWYWLTVLLLHEQPETVLIPYVRRVAYPLGIAFAAGSAALTVAAYRDDWLFRWSAPIRLPAERVVYSHYHLSEGPLHPAFIALLVSTTVAAALNIGLGWRLTRDGARKRRLAWLFVSALLFVVAANTLGIAASINLSGDREVGLSHILLGAAMLAMVWNVAAYGLLLRGQVMRRDALYFLTSLAAICLLYAVTYIAVIGSAYSFRLLSLFVILLVLVILSHALIDVGRRALEPLFFGRDVQLLRSNLSSAAQDAALAADLGPVLVQAQQEIGEASSEHLFRLTEEALRRVNNPAALARSMLIFRVPRMLSSSALWDGTLASADATPLRQAQALRQTLIAALERLRPADAADGSAAVLQYEILTEEYLEGLPNKQITIRHNISESTFHRNRREAIEILARELGRQEDALSSQG